MASASHCGGASGAEQQISGMDTEEDSRVKTVAFSAGSLFRHHIVVCWALTLPVLRTPSAKMT